MKKVQIRLSEQTYEDLVRIANGVPLQRYLEGMIELATTGAWSTVESQTPPRPAKMDLTATPDYVAAHPEPGSVDERYMAARDKEAMSLELCRMCAKAGPPKTKPCPKCGALAP